MTRPFSGMPGLPNWKVCSIDIYGGWVQNPLMKTIGWWLAALGSAALTILAGCAVPFMTLMVGAAVAPISMLWLLLVLPCGAAATGYAMMQGFKLYGFVREYL